MVNQRSARGRDRNQWAGRWTLPEKLGAELIEAGNEDDRLYVDPQFINVSVGRRSIEGTFLDHTGKLYGGAFEFTQSVSGCGCRVSIQNVGQGWRVIAGRAFVKEL